LYSYQAGTLTPQATYTDATLTVPNPNPIILDAFGTAAVWLSSNAYKFNLLDVNGVQQADFPIDNVTGFAAVLADLASTAAGQGAALVGYHSGGNPAGSVGNALDNQITGSAIVSQTFQAFATGGTGSAYTLTPTPALAANAANVRFNATFNAAGTGSPTLAVSGLTALPLMAYNSAGVLVSYLPTASQVSDVVCDGTHWIVMDTLPAKGTASGGRFRNLIVTYGQSSGTVTITADEVTVSDLNGNQTRLSSVSVAALLGAVGVINGTDGSTQTAGSFYTVWVGYNPTTAAVGALISAEPASPITALLGPASPISGYTQYACVSINKIKALTPSYWQPAVQRGNRITWTVGSYLTGLPLIVSGSVGSYATPTWVAQTVVGNGAHFPYHAAAGTFLHASGGGTLHSILAPNAFYGAFLSTANPPVQFCTVSGQGGEAWAPFDLNLEALTVQWASDGAYLYSVGCTLNL
jgi:hypothetical protein